MTIQYKIEFDQLEWTSPIKGVRHKYIDQDGLRLRLVEYTKEMPLHWCEKGHYGYVIQGEIEIECGNERRIFKTGDGVFLPDGADHRHRAKVLSEPVLIFFMEKV